MSFGVPYQGSKNKIARWILDNLPAADILIDMFAGGCAITHAAIISGKYDKVVANDLDGSGIRLFRDSIEGKYKNEKRWISRDDFFRLKDQDDYIKLCWSFGNDCKSYLYAKSKEEYKRRLWGQKVQGIEFETIQSLVSLNRLQSLVSLNRLQSLEHLNPLKYKVEFTFLDYRQVTVPGNSIIYADIPYRNTKGYLIQFDHDAFYDWARNQNVPVFISEYEMPDDFQVIAEKQRKDFLGTPINGKCGDRVEKIFLKMPR